MTKYTPKHFSSRSGRLADARLGAAAVRSGRSALAVGVAAGMPATAALASSAFADEQPGSSSTGAQRSQTAHPLLKLDDHGSDVVDVQTLLTLVRDGYYGPVTAQAVKSFQKANGLEVDGVVGVQTWNKLALASTRIGATPGSSQAILQLGNVGTVVRSVQAQLNVPADGVFGPQTLAAVRDFQRTQGLVVDGVVGPMTSTRLAEVALKAAPDATAPQTTERPKSKTTKTEAKKKAEETKKASQETVSRSQQQPSVADPNAFYDLPFLPGEGYVITQGPFGTFSHHKWNDKHAVDFGTPVGTSIVSSAPGTVYSTGSDVTGGNYVLIKDATGYCMEYAHLDSIKVQAGQSVARGELIARSGATGEGITGPHLHWGIVDCSNFTSIRIADSKELGTTYTVGTLAVAARKAE